MTDAGHADRAHSRLGPSGASRWMACPGSVNLEKMFPDTTTEAAEEGTAAHELAEILLQGLIGTVDQDKLTRFEKENRFYSQGMRDYVDEYVALVEERLNEAIARTPDPLVLFEKRLRYDDWAPDGYGTGDVVIIADDLIDVIDLKYGKGVPVNAKNNPQGRLYGLGALNGYGFLYDISRVRVTIFQPRLDSETTEELTVTELLKWADDEIRPAALATQDPKAPTIAGEHCRFCSARSQCRARAEWVMNHTQQYEQKDPRLLTPEEISDVLGRVDSLVKWADDVKSFAFEQAEKFGVNFPGYKLVAGRSNRIFTDKPAVATMLDLEGYSEDEIYKPRDMKGIGDLEDLLGKKKFAELLGSYLIKPSGKPALVPDSDPRPGMSSIDSAISDFADDLPD